MSDLRQLLSSYNEIRSRLRYPPNAVADDGIDLKRKRIPSKAEDVATEPSPSCRVFIKEIPFVPAPKLGLSLAVIEHAVCTHFGITKTILYAHRRTQLVVYPRHICWYLACRHTILSLPVIGRKFGCDHTTIIHARDKIAALILMDPVTADIIAKLERVLFPDGVDQPEPAVATVSQLDMAEKQEVSLPQSEICSMD